MTAPLRDAQAHERYLAHHGNGTRLLVVLDLDERLVVSWDYSILGDVTEWPGFQGNDWTYEKVER